MSDHDLPDLGPCCACERTRAQGAHVRNIMMLDLHAPVPGTGWGCLQCGRPNDGALAVLCDECVNANVPLRFVVSGLVASQGRVPIETLTEPFHHDLSQHPEVTDARRSRQARLN